MIAQQDSIRTYSSFGIFDNVMDRFGRDHSWSDLRLDSVTTSNVFIESIGMFDLYFFDGCGLEDSSNTTHNQRRAVLKELFSFANDVWNSSTISGRIPVRFLPQTMGDSLPSGFPVLASSFYFTPAFSAQFSEVSDCAISQMINAGNNPYYALANYSTQRSMSGGLISFSMLDFYTDFDSYQLNTDLQLSVVNATTYDLYSVALRELLIGLGLNSLMRINTESLSANTFQYSRFDQQIHWQNQPVLIYQSSLKKYIPNPLVDFSSFLIAGTSNCDSIVSCIASPYVADSTIRLHSSHCFQPGIDLSYTQPVCSNLPSVLSSEWGVGTVRRRMTADDMKLLCAIGYTINGCFGDSTISNNFCGTGLSSFNVHSVNFSGLTSNGSYKHVVTDSLEVFALSELIDQYNLVTGIAFVDFLGVANGPQLIGDSLYLTSIHLGQQIIRLQLGYDNAFNSTHYLLIRYRGGQVCNYNNCNLVGNDSFEETFEDVECGEMENGPANTVTLFCWTPFGTNNTPDLYSENCQQSLWDFSDGGTAEDSGDIPVNPDPLNNRIVHLVSALLPVNDPFSPSTAAYAEESIQGQLLQPLVEGNSYEISLRVFRRLPGGIPRLRIFFRSGEYGGDGLVIGNPSNYGLTSVGTTYEVTENEWVTISFQFTCPASDMPLDYIVIHNQASGPPPTTWALDFRWLYIDDVRLSLQQSATFNIPQDFVCNNVPLNSLQNFGSPLGGEVFGPGVIGNTSFTFVPGLAGPGTHEITYTVTIYDGCQLMASDLITVHPTVSFGTPLITPTCGQSCSGSLSVNPTLSPTTTTATVTYTWTGPSINAANQNLLSLTNLCAGTYTLTAVVNGVCISQQNYFVPSAAPPTASANVSFDICNVSCNSTIQVTTNNPSNTISWTGGLNGFNPTSVCPGIYTATVTNPQGCSTSIQVNVNPTAGVNLEVNNDQVIEASTIGYHNITIGTNGYLSIIGNSNISVSGTITVNSGGRLRINGSTIRFSPTARIIILEGGRTLISQSTLRSLCPNQFWQGIQVEGNPQYDQNDASVSINNFNVPPTNTDNQINQGAIRVVNNSIIEQARVGLRLFKPNGFSSINSGGLAIVLNSTFRNNVCDLMIRNYGSATFANLSKFGNVTFQLTPSLFPTIPNNQLGDRVQLSNTYGINFSKCKWLNSNTSIINSNILGIVNSCAIRSNSASFDVLGGANNESMISGFIRGVVTNSGYSSLSQITIRNTQFRCYRAIYCQHLPSGSVINSNIFSALNSHPPMSNIAIPQVCFDTQVDQFLNNSEQAMYSTNLVQGPAYGLYLGACWNVEIMDNDFNIEGANNVLRIGLFVNNCDASIINIYENRFRRNTVGIRFFNKNRGSEASIGGTSFSCNDFGENGRGVEFKASNPSLSSNGINQNIFYIPNFNIHSYTNSFLSQTNNQIFPNLRHIRSDIQGYHDFRALAPGEVNPFEVGGYGQNQSSNFAEEYDDVLASQLCNQTNLFKSISQIEQELTALDSLKQDYRSFLDGGNPDYIQSIIDDITLSNIIQSYNTLSEQSPSLSFERICEIIEKETEIPRSMLLSILIQNSSSLKNGYTWSALDSMSNPLTIWEKDSLISTFSQVDQKQSKEIRLNQAMSASMKDLNFWWEVIRNDSTILDKSTYRDLYWSSLFQITGEYFRLEYYMLQRNWPELLNTAESLQANLDPRLIDFQDLEKLKELCNTLVEINLLDSTTQNSLANALNEFTNPSFPLSYGLATSLLMQYDSSSFHMDTDYPDAAFLRSKKFKESHFPQNHVLLYPNPTDQVLILEDHSLDLNSMNFDIIDIAGKTIPLPIVSRQKTQVVWNTQHLPNGTYLVKVLQGEENIVTQKFTIQR